MLSNTAKKVLRSMVRKTGAARLLGGLRGRGIRAIRLCRRFFSHSPQAAVRTVPYRLYQLSAGRLPTWFGYYDKTPFSGDDNKILAMAMTYPKDWSKKASQFPVRVGWFDWSEVVSGKTEFHVFGETASWSWQQGCMLQWFPKDADRLVLYNWFVEGRYGCVVQDVFTGDVERSYDLPVYAVDSAGRRAVTVNFSRLERLRSGYGYFNLPDETASQACPEEDGIWQVNLETGTHELLLSLREIADFQSLCSMVGVPHYVNHLLFSPNGNRVVFLHLWVPEGGRRNRLMLYDFDDRSLHVLDDAAVASHFNWLSDERLICFRYPQQGDRGYYVYTLGSNYTVQCERMQAMPVDDGHPSLSPSGGGLLTDTYPDRAGEQAIYVYSVSEKTLLKRNCVFSPFRYRGPLRCDLHPRWDRTGSRICFDSTERGRRMLYVLELAAGETQWI